MATLKTICAWCGVLIREGTEPVTHGICDGCLKSQMESETKTEPPFEENAMITKAMRRDTATVERIVSFLQSNADSLDGDGALQAEALRHAAHVIKEELNVDDGDLAFLPDGSAKE